MAFAAAAHHRRPPPRKGPARPTWRRSWRPLLSRPSFGARCRLQAALFLEALSRFMLSMQDPEVLRRFDHCRPLPGIIDNTVLLGYEGWVGEIEDLLCLLRVDGCKNRDLIFSSTCLFDLCDRITVFTRAHSYLLTRIKEYNPVHYEEILSELVFRYDWEDPVKDNDHLLECYNARKTDNQKKVKAMKQARVLSSQGGNQQSNGLIIGPPSHGNPSRGQSTAPPKRASTSKTHHQLNKGKAPAAPPPPLPTQQHKKPFVQKYNLPGCDLREEVMAFYRNVGTHGMDRSMKKLREVYGLPGLNVMLLSLLPHLASSLMRALHTRGYLSLVDLPRLLK